MSRLCIINTVPLYRDIAPYVSILLEDTGAELLSAYRGTQGRAPFLLHKYGHSTQKDLYDGYVAHRPGFNPANAPGHSTHELFSDAQAYTFITYGSPLKWWMQGIDVNGGTQADQMIAAAAKRGWAMFRPYPSGSEIHHVNFRLQPHAKDKRTAARILKLRATLPRS